MSQIDELRSGNYTLETSEPLVFPEILVAGEPLTIKIKRLTTGELASEAKESENLSVPEQIRASIPIVIAASLDAETGKKLFETDDAAMIEQWPNAVIRDIYHKVLEFSRLTDESIEAHKKKSAINQSSNSVSP